MAILADLLKAHYGIETYEAVNRVTSQVLTTVTELCKNNPDRLGLVIVNNGSNAFYLSNTNDVSAIKGLYVGPFGGTVSFDWTKDFSLIANNWYGIAPAGTVNTTIFEIIGLKVEVK